MGKLHIISKEHFLKRIGDLCLRSGLTGFPKDDSDQHILLKSAVIMIGAADAFSEQEINEKLKAWCQATQSKGIDHGTLRRRLVDTGYLVRNKNGSAYRVCPNGLSKFEFEAAIDQINLPESVASAKDEIERRKRMYLEKSRRA